MKAKKKGMNLKLDDNTMNQPNTNIESFEINAQGVLLKNVNLEVKTTGIVDTKSGDMNMIDVNEFQQIKRIGNGACGEVQLAFHKPSNKYVAIKFINILDKDKRHQLVKDLKVLFKAHSKNLINCFGGFYIEGNVGLVLELMNLGSLGNLISESFNLNLKMTEPIMANIILKILKGLAFLHLHLKTIHRDLKPGNILVNIQGDVKLTDFGISKELVATGNFSQTFVGTSAYMSPERIDNSGYSYNSDVWSLGITIIEMVTGKNPYPLNASPLELVNWIVQKPTPTLTAEMGCSNQFIDFTNLCLEKNKALRKTANDLIPHPWFTCAAKEEEYIKWLELVGKNILINPQN